MNIALWIAAAVLALAFAAAGLMKITQPRAKLAETGQGWAGDFSDGAVKGIGAAEFLGALGLILPAALDTATVLVPAAACGLAALMLGAAITHARRREYPNITINVVLTGLALFVAVARFGSYAF
ncbi:DoxX family protein [Streptomyces sp. NPDC091217]|uniref:DoxX family protein n=1 Tax=Streptomyces sp. NPDC091217 TaxID=3365975 RepID=UPI00380EF447